MQGTVLAVEVAEGDEVEAGQVICIVEAMKMENEIAAHRAGVVTELSVEPGQAVRRGQVICVLSTGSLRRGSRSPSTSIRRRWTSTSTRARSCSRRFGIPVSEGRLATTPAEARAAAEELGGPVVVKAQVLTGGRGKAGGVKLADEPGRRRAEGRARSSASTSTATSCASSGSSRPRRSPRSTTSRSRSTAATKKALFMLTTEGGVEIEEVAENNPDALARLHVDPLEGFQPYQARRLIYGAGIDDPSEQKQILDIIGRLYRCFVETDAMLCEINPLIVTPEGEVRALDSKFTVDDNALYRHPDIAAMRDLEAYPPEERAAREKGVTYVKLDGEVGILGNGAGLVMSTLDVIALVGGRPANFCDLGGGGDAQGVVDALEIITRRPAGALDPLQHLRRDHSLRRRRAWDPAGARPDEDRAPDRRPLRRDERRGGPRDPRRGRAAEPACRGDDARRRQARRGVGRMSDVWSERAQAYRDSPTHREGRRPRPARRMVRARGGREGAGRRHRRRACRAAAARGRREVVTLDPVAGHAGRRGRERGAHPFADGSFDVVVSRIAPHHFERRARCGWPRWRASATGSW